MGDCPSIIDCSATTPVHSPRRSQHLSHTSTIIKNARLNDMYIYYMMRFLGRHKDYFISCSGYATCVVIYDTKCGGHKGPFHAVSAPAKYDKVSFAVKNIYRYQQQRYDTSATMNKSNAIRFLSITVRLGYSGTQDLTAVMLDGYSQRRRQQELVTKHTWKGLHIRQRQNSDACHLYTILYPPVGQFHVSCFFRHDRSHKKKTKKKQPILSVCRLLSVYARASAGNHTESPTACVIQTRIHYCCITWLVFVGSCRTACNSVLESTDLSYRIRIMSHQKQKLHN